MRHHRHPTAPPHHDQFYCSLVIVLHDSKGLYWVSCGGWRCAVVGSSRGAKQEPMCREPDRWQPRCTRVSTIAGTAVTLPWSCFHERPEFPELDPGTRQHPDQGPALALRRVRDAVLQSSRRRGVHPPRHLGPDLPHLGQSNLQVQLQSGSQR